MARQPKVTRTWRDIESDYRVIKKERDAFLKARCRVRYSNFDKMDWDDSWNEGGVMTQSAAMEYEEKALQLELAQELAEENG